MVRYLRGFMFLHLWPAALIFADEGRIDLKPLQDQDYIPPKAKAVTSKLLTAQQKDAKVFYFETIVFQGCTVLSDTDQKRLIKPYLKKKICLNDLNNLIMAIHVAYGDAGYVLENVYFKKESFKKPRHLVMFLVEPKVCALRIFERRKRGRRVNNLIKVDADNVLKVTDWQCASDILRQLETFSAHKFRLNTDRERTYHTADVMLKKGQTCAFGLGYDNQGSKNTGRDRYTIQARFEDVLGMFEQWQFTHITTHDPFSKDRYSQTSLVSLSVPYRRWRASFYGIFEKDKHPITNRAFSKTEQIQLGADLRYALSKSWTSGTYVGSTIEHYSKSRYLNGHRLSILSGDVTKWILWGSHYRYIFGGVVYGKLSYSQGIHASDMGMGSYFPKNFKKLNINGFFQRNFGSRWLWTLSGDVQIGEPKLFEHEKFSLGGTSTIRGFFSPQYQTDSGFFIRNELEYLLDFLQKSFYKNR